MNHLRTSVIAAAAPWASGAAWAQNGNMMGGSWGSGWMGGYGGPWVPVLLLIGVIALAVWVVKRK
jgi:hypothetical protein